jgi:peptidoglycan pentaglycine glycine transferase (the first glycine)
MVRQMAAVNVRQVDPADRTRFDRCVAAMPRPDFLQTWEWGELKATTGWTPIRLLATSDGTDIAAMSILERRVPGLGVLHYAPRGPLMDWSRESTVRACLAAAADLGRERGAVALKIDPGVPDGDATCLSALQRNGFQALKTGENFEGVQPQHVMHLPIEGRSADDLLASFHPKTRYNIRLAERRGVRVRVGRREDLPAFYDALLETARRDHFVVRARTYFESMYDTCLANGIGRLWLAEAQDGELLAGAIAFQLGGITWYLYGASRNARRELMAPYAVQWSMIHWAMEAHCRLYDFRGVSGDLSPHNPLYGLYRFKKGFGADLVRYVGEFDRPYRPLRLWAYHRALPVARWLVRRRAADGDAAGDGGRE